MTTVALEDAKLASWFASGEADSVRVVYQTYGRLVFAIAFRVLGDFGLAEDATQQTFVQAWRAAGSYDPSRALAAWLSTIAKRVAIDVQRRERRHRDLDNIDTSESASLVTLPPSAEQIHDVAEVRRALDELPPSERDLIRMQHFEELSQAEIADKLKVPLGTVKSRAFRAHRRLASILQGLRAEPTDSAPADPHSPQPRIGVPHREPRKRSRPPGGIIASGAAPPYVRRPDPVRRGGCDLLRMSRMQTPASCSP